MALLDILVHPDARLRTVAQPVQHFDAALTTLIADMFETLYASKAIGLAATQVDRHLQLLAIDVSGNASQPLVFINPQVLTHSVPGIVEESCLSLPGICERVERATQLRVRSHDPNGEIFERNLEDLAAVCLQHEMDHLQGVLFVDRLSLFRRLRLRGRLRQSQRRLA